MMDCQSSNNSDNSFGNSAKKVKLEDDSSDVNTINPVFLLNKVHAGLKYNILEQSGPPHKPLYKITVELNGKVYFGTGNSKIAAKYEAATNALKDNDINLTIEEPKNSANEEKNSIAILNELRPDIKYNIEQSGPPHKPTFKVSIEIDGKVYDGTGNSKQIAKCEAANLALQDNPKRLTNNKVEQNCAKGEKSPVAILNELRAGLQYHVIEQSGPSHNPTFRIKLEINGKEYFGTGNSKTIAKCEAAAQVLYENPDLANDNHKRKKVTLKKVVTDGKSAVVILNELRPNLQYNVLEQLGPQHKPTFKISVEVDGQIYYGTGITKKAAKCEAAAQALKLLIPDDTNMVNDGRVENGKMDISNDQIK